LGDAETVTVCRSGCTAFIVNVYDLESLLAELDAIIVKFDVPAVAGVPDITPVFSLSDKPLGSEPDETDHLIGVEPVACKVWL
jgi:hypothetical protein